MARETFFPFLSLVPEFFGHQKRARIALNIMKIAQKVGILIISAVQKCAVVRSKDKELVSNLVLKKLETFFDGEPTEDNSSMNFKLEKCIFPQIRQEISPIFLPFLLPTTSIRKHVM
eukprot:06717.XXX_42297_42647_1 [CDS] Oithona nana genome sequencing.